jgi:GT2 family glycosyltransferase
MSSRPSVAAVAAVPVVAVVVVCWNCRADIERCLASLEANTDYPNWRTIVIDNASSDGTREWLLARPPGRIELVLAERNLGWVGALNLSLRAYQPDHFFFLNPDAFVEPGWLAPLVAALENDPRAGFASPKFRYLDGSIHYAGAYLAPTGGMRVYGHGEHDGFGHDSARVIPFAHGQCLVRAAMARDVGYFDDGFGIGYFEEVDYQLRARRKRWRALYVPDSVIVHATAQAFKLHPGGFKEELMIRNWLRVMTLHWPLSWLAWRLPLELLRPLRNIRGGVDLAPTLRAWRGWATMLPEMVARRSAIAREGESLDFSALQHPV